MKKCSVCEEKYYAKGLCKLHYIRERTIRIKSPSWDKTCTVCGVVYFNKSSVSRSRYCKPCGYKINVNNHRIANRIKYGIPLDKPIVGKKRNGEGYICPQGYKWFSNIDHPNAYSKLKRIGEHTLVLTKHLGRSLTKNESVHHKNGIRNDNRIENLELWHRGQPAGQRLEDKIKWAKDFLSKYGYIISARSKI